MSIRVKSKALGRIVYIRLKDPSEKIKEADIYSDPNYRSISNNPAHYSGNSENVYDIGGCLYTTRELCRIMFDDRHQYKASCCIGAVIKDSEHAHRMYFEVKIPGAVSE